MVENNEIMLLAAEDEVLLTVKEYVGPTCLMQGQGKEDLAASICARYSDAPRDRHVVVRFLDKNDVTIKEVSVIAADKEEVKKYMI